MMLTPFPESLGFRSGASSAHTSRTMMLAELTLVLNGVDPKAPAEGYRSAIIDDNILGKPTRTTRQRSAKRLTELYALDPACTLFRLLRHFWPADPSSQPMLAFLLASARDTLLREATPFVLGVKLGEIVTADAIGEHLNQKYPTRFRPTTLHSTAQNLASSWTQAGYLPARSRRTGQADRHAGRSALPACWGIFVARGESCRWIRRGPGFWTVRPPNLPT